VFSTYALIPLIGQAVGSPAFKIKGEATMRLERPFGAPRLNGLPAMSAGCVPSA
jgi:hypothetical protein